MHRRPILECSKRNFKYKKMPSYILSPISSPFELLSASLRQVVYVLLTRSPRCYSRSYSPFDLHVLGMPPALILSQDQTLNKSLSYSTCFYLVFKDLVNIATSTAALLIILHLVLFVNTFLKLFLIFLKKHISRSVSYNIIPQPFIKCKSFFIFIFLNKNTIYYITVISILFLF